MLYFSQLLNKTIYQNNKPYGKLVDMAVVENRPNPPISKIEILRGKEKITVAPSAIHVEDHHLVLTSAHIPILPYDHKDFYLAEDLLDKQVIDTDGRRLVRVNDVLLEGNGELKAVGIDIGLAGILRRLGLGKLLTTTTILPWHVIEAFDYQTGNIRIKLRQSSLNTLHPADIADILEDVGTKERVGIVESLDPQKAAKAIEEADEETQISILESLKPQVIKDIVNKMHIAEIADIISDLNPLKAKEVQTALGTDKALSVKNLGRFADNVAGGFMHLSFFKEDGGILVKEVLSRIKERGSVPETVVVTNGNGKIAGIINTKDLLLTDQLAYLKEIITDKKFVFATTPLSVILRLFAQYNLRVVPVVNSEKQPIGIILIDDILKYIEQENEKNENL